MSRRTTTVHHPVQRVGLCFPLAPAGWRMGASSADASSSTSAPVVDAVDISGSQTERRKDLGIALHGHGRYVREPPLPVTHEI